MRPPYPAACCPSSPGPAKLYAVATGLSNKDSLIESAVQLYLEDKTHLKSHKGATEHLAAIFHHYKGKPMSELPAIARAVCADPRAPATNKNRLALLKAACRWAWKQHNLTESDPTTRMQLPPVRNERHVYVTRREMLKLAAATKKRELRALIRIAFYTGMRLGEILRVEVMDNMLVIPDTKNGDRRAVPVHRRIRVCLKFIPLAMPKSNIEWHFRVARNKAGLEHVHIHDLRHSAASEMINQGVDLYTVGAVLGHKDARSTKRYAHLNAETLAKAVEAIGGQKSPHKDARPGTRKAA